MLDAGNDHNNNSDDNDNSTVCSNDITNNSHTQMKDGNNDDNAGMPMSSHAPMLSRKGTKWSRCMWRGGR